MRIKGSEEHKGTSIAQRLEEAIETFGRSGVAELVELYRRPWRMLYLNLLFGVARGFGVAVGFSLVSALFVWLLVRLASLNLPVIGEFIASIAALVQYHMSDP